MRFFSLLLFFLCFTVFGADTKETILSREYGNCQTNNLSYSAMKFYKIPTETENHFQRLIYFFNDDGTVVIRKTLQELISCQTGSNGEEICSYRPKSDQWTKESYTLESDNIILERETINWINKENINRGFELKLENKKYQGGMVVVNFNQSGINTASICK